MPVGSQKKETKRVQANEKALSALPFDSGMWRVVGVPGLYLRCRAQSKSFMLHRRVRGELLRETLGELGELSMKAAKDKALTKWNAMRPKAAHDGAITLDTAIEQYLEEKLRAGKLADKTAKIARYNRDRYLAEWKGRSLEDIGRDRVGVRLLQQRITGDHGAASSNQVVRLLSAVYRWHRKVNTDLPESPMVVAEIHRIKPRDWAYSSEELKAWWRSAKKEDDGTVTPLGVSTLSSLKRMWWLTALFTGARKGSVEALKWADVDSEKKTIHFRVTKGDRPYVVPIANKLMELLDRYRKGADVPSSEWVFPSPMIEGAHLVDVKNPNEGVGPAHRLRHTFRTTLAELGASPDHARLLMGHSLGGDVSRGYITSSLVTDSLRPMVDAVSLRYLKVLGIEV